MRARAWLALSALLAAGAVYWFWPRPAPVDVARVGRGVVGARADVLRVPLDALVRRGNRWFAWEVEDGHVNEAPVSLGERDASYAEVVAGLAERDEVVRRPAPDLAPGRAVSAR